MNKSNKQDNIVINHRKESQNLKNDVKQAAKIEGELVLESLYERSMKEAERLKMLTILYMSVFFLFAVMTIAFAATLYAYPAQHLVWHDGSTLWGIVVFKLLIFIPLAFLLWFFGVQTRKAKATYELALARSFILKFAEEMLAADDRKDFLKTFLKDFVIKSIGNHKVITS